MGFSGLSIYKIYISDPLDEYMAYQSAEKRATKPKIHYKIFLNPASKRLSSNPSASAILAFVRLIIIQSNEP